MDSDVNELCKSKREFDDAMNKIKDFDDSVNENHCNTLHIFYDILIYQPSIPGYFTKRPTTGVNIFQKNFIFKLAEVLSSDLFTVNQISDLHDEPNASFSLLSDVQNPNLQKSCHLGY